MKIAFECQHCGKCCGPVALSESEHVRIKRTLRKMPAEELERIKNQKRPPLKCILYDMENNRCSVYDARPEICRMFGFYEGLQCPNNKEFAKKSREEGKRRIDEALGSDKFVGVTSIDITWENVMGKVMDSKGE